MLGPVNSVASQAGVGGVGLPRMQPNAAASTAFDAHLDELRRAVATTPVITPNMTPPERAAVYVERLTAAAAKGSLSAAQRAELVKYTSVAASTASIPTRATAAASVGAADAVDPVQTPQSPRYPDGSPQAQALANPSALYMTAGTGGNLVSFTPAQAQQWWAAWLAHPFDLRLVAPGALPGSLVLTADQLAQAVATNQTVLPPPPAGFPFPLPPNPNLTPGSNTLTGIQRQQAAGNPSYPAFDPGVTFSASGPQYPGVQPPVTESSLVVPSGASTP